MGVDPEVGDGAWERAIARARLGAASRHPFECALREGRLPREVGGLWLIHRERAERALTGSAEVPAWTALAALCQAPLLSVVEHACKAAEGVPESPSLRAAAAAVEAEADPIDWRRLASALPPQCASLLERLAETCSPQRRQGAMEEEEQALLAAIDRRARLRRQILDALRCACSWPRLAAHALRRREGGDEVLVLSEKAVRIGGSGGALLDRIDGRKRGDAIARDFAAQHQDVSDAEDEALRFLERMRRAGAIDLSWEPV